MDLTAKQKRFCEEYRIDFNGTRAAIRAGYSKKTANEQAARLLAKVSAQDFIAKLQQKLAAKTEITAEKVIAELVKIGFNNLQDYIDQDNEVKDLSQIPRDHAAAVESIKKTTTEWGHGDVTTGTKTTIQFKLYDKISALEKLGRHLGIFEADNSQKKAIINVSIDDE